MTLMRNPAPIIATLFLGVLVVYLLLRPTPEPDQNSQPQPATKTAKSPVDGTLETEPNKKDTPPRPVTPLSLLAENPDWSELNPYQHTITRPVFEELLTRVFTTDDTWRQYITIHETHAEVLTSLDPAETPFILNFASSEKSAASPRRWKQSDSLPIPPKEKPLSKLHIAIDPGHIGGKWAKIEARWFQIGEGTPVTEGDMTLKVAKLLKPKLESMGAKVTLVRSKPEPVTPLRPKDFNQLAQTSDSDDPESLRRFAEKIFYRTAEIRARADLVNQTIRPDLVLCLHFNAEAWGDPANPTLVPRTHFHILVNGAYTTDEIHLADQRFAMLKKLLQRTHSEETLVGKTIAETFASISRLPPYKYHSGGNNFRKIPSSKFIYARNLLANRLYDCPVIFMEPYVMNSTIDYPRIQAGDYEGLRKFNGTPRPSIFREYAAALAKGLSNHYGRKR